MNPTPSAEAGPNQTIDVGTATTLDGSGSGGTGAYTWLWEPASLLVQNDIPNPQTTILTEPVLYTLIVTDEKNCSSEPDQVLVNTEGSSLSALPLADPPSICAGEEVLVTANATGGGGDYTYSWTSDPPGFTSSQPSFTATPSVSTRYDLLLKDQYDNEFTAHVNVTVNPLPVVELVPDGATTIGPDTIAVCVRDSVWLDAGFDSDPPGTLYHWSNNYEGRFYRATTNGNWIDWQSHSVEVRDGTTSCANTGKITIFFDFNMCAIGVPESKVRLEEAISIQPNPNQGSFNLVIKEDISDLTVAIYDIGGREVYADFLEGTYNSGERFPVNPDRLDRGLYFVRLSSGSKSIVQKMIVQ